VAHPTTADRREFGRFELSGLYTVGLDRLSTNKLYWTPPAMARSRAGDQGEARSRRERDRYVRGGVFGLRHHARRADCRRTRLAEHGEGLRDEPNAAAVAGDRRDGGR
jgi:hypothetical protein